ncbi:hypothetical protein [Deferribacter abyssi]|uniref:hypothetical protein n=1 Tax=Deferribacter abyssi TaxID=213806 RepID=UPI003C1E9C3F
MTVKDIVIKYLKENGYDGLFDEVLECGCRIGDLMPCYNPQNCSPGRIKDCKKCDKYINDKYGCLEGYNFCIQEIGVQE